MYRAASCLFVLLTLLSAARSPVQAQSAEAGEAVFKSQCGPCHVTERGKEKVGPSLFGVTGPGGPFSGLVELDHYLEAPRVILPETRMTYPGLKDPQKRKDLIAYLSTLN